MNRLWIDPQDFQDLRKHSGLTRRQVAEALNVTVRTIQNWETGGARIPWMAYRMLRILRGYALPGKDWEGWTISGDLLIPPGGRPLDAANLLYLGAVFAQAKLWRQMYARSGRAKTAQMVVQLPKRRRTQDDEHNTQHTRIGGIR